VKTTVNKAHAKTKLAPTPATKIIIFFQSFALIKLSFALKSSSSFGSSPLSLTNQPSGKRLRVYSVPDLSVRSLHTFGGIPIPNSKTFTQLFFALIKCPNS
jgi:hypothetical protein